jgi:non-canonical (house-cleaning) NTP pyrophosphatase
MMAFAWIVVKSQDQEGNSRSGTFLLPHLIVDLIRQGVELGEADDRVFGRSNSKQGNGAIGILTNDVIDRTALYEHAVILALTPFVKKELYLHAP